MNNKEFNIPKDLGTTEAVPEILPNEKNNLPHMESIDSEHNGYETADEDEPEDGAGNDNEETSNDSKQEEIIKDEKQQDKAEKKDEKKDDDGGSSEHNGKYFVIQKGKAKCNQGISFPSFKVTSHHKHYWNDAEGQADYLAVTEDDLQFNPPAQPFGAQCKLQPTTTGYKPCSYLPAGKWQKCYDKVKVMGKSCVTELSELQCVIGGKITVMKHGQQSEVGKSNVKNTEPHLQHIYNPIIDFQEFQEEELENNDDAW